MNASKDPSKEKEDNAKESGTKRSLRPEKKPRRPYREMGALLEARKGT